MHAGTVTGNTIEISHVDSWAGDCLLAIGGTVAAQKVNLISHHWPHGAAKTGAAVEAGEDATARLISCLNVVYRRTIQHD